MAGGQVGAVGQVGEQLAGAGGVQDDVLDAGVEAVEVEEVAGGGRVAEPVADVFDPVGGGRDGGAVRAGGQVQVAEGDETDRAQGCLLLGVNGRERAERRARPGRAGRGAPGRCYWVMVSVTTRNWSVRRSMTT